MPNSLARLKAQYPSVALVSGADLDFLRSCHLDPKSDKLHSTATGEIFLSKDLCLLFKLIRETLKIPLTVTDGSRTNEDVERLEHQGYYVAKNSPHLYGTAFDLAIPRGWTHATFAQFILKLAKGKVRVGWKVYAQRGENLIHIDVAFLLKDKDGHSPDPVNFKPGVTW